MLQISYRLPSLRDPTLAFCKIITIKTRKKQQKNPLFYLYHYFSIPLYSNSVSADLVFPLIIVYQVTSY